jgi:hypothetical protein
MSKTEDDLKRRITELENKINPPPRTPTAAPYDHTQGMSMPPSAMRAMVEAIPETLMRELRADSRRPNPVSVGTTQTTQSQPQPAVKRGKEINHPSKLPTSLSVMRLSMLRMHRTKRTLRSS